MTSPTCGELSLAEAAALIAGRTRSALPGEYALTVGTDSQNTDRTKAVLVIALHHRGHGGIFFYEVHTAPRIRSIASKLYFETSLSLECAEKLMAVFETMRERGEYDYTKHLSLAIHVDAGLNGPSGQMIPEIVGWITSCGYTAVTKPDSYAASSIANRYSKQSAAPAEFPSPVQAGLRGEQNHV